MAKKTETKSPATSTAVAASTDPSTAVVEEPKAAADPAIDDTANNPTPATKEAMTTESKGAGTSLAIVSPNTAAVVAADGAANPLAGLKALASRLPPKYREDVLFLKRPTPEDLLDLVMKLPDNVSSKMMELVRKTRPKKQGAHTSKDGFSPTQIRLNQGTGNDPARPPKHPAGDFYTTDSRTMGDSIRMVVLGFYEGRTMWPARDSDSANKGPICFSMDRTTGSRYGDCASCPNASKKYNEGGCGRDLTIWFIDEAMTGIYEFKFSKSSIGGGEALARVLSKSENIWDRYFDLRNDGKTEGTNRWFMTKAPPVSDPKDPTASATDKQLHPLFEALSKLMDADVFYPNLADVYDRSKSSNDTSTAQVGADDAALLGNTAADGTDYSKDGDNPSL